MRILVLSQYFWPEEFLVNDFVLHLRERGHEVEVLTGLPNYPSGKFFSGYGYCGPYRDDYHGIPVWRSPLIPRGNSGGLRLMANYFSFALLASMRVLFLRRPAFDLILVFQFSPVLVGIPARVMKMLTGVPLFFWIHDLWPESLSATGAIRSRFALNLVGKITGWIYKGCDRILVQSQAFRESVSMYGARPEQVFYLPNCAEDFFQPVVLPQDAPERALMPEGFRVMFAGNIGVAQDFETILSAAELTRERPIIQWVIVGDGRHRSWVENEIQQRKLANVHLLGRHDKEKMPAFFSLADVMLVSLKREPIFALTVPAKVQAYLACGKPILSSLDGEGSRIIEEAKAGLAVPAESPEQLAEAARKLSLLASDKLLEMGSNARTYFEENFSRVHLMDTFDGLLNQFFKQENRREKK